MKGGLGGGDNAMDVNFVPARPIAGPTSRFHGNVFDVWRQARHFVFAFELQRTYPSKTYVLYEKTAAQA